MNIILRIILLMVINLVIIQSCENVNAETTITRVFPNLVFSKPVDIQNAADGSNRIFVVEQSGKIIVFDNNNNVKTKTEFLNIEEQVLYGGERGLLGLAFHPEYNTNGFFYINYTTNNPRRTVISRFQVSQKDQNIADNSSEVIILEVEQPYSNHNGGQIVFGPDKYLYISFGDGGSGGDPQNNSQNLSMMLGSIIRIDINNQENGEQYAIPSDNPFKNNSNNYLEEIFAYGLRNVWKFSFDSFGNLWAADVGQNKWEEINLIKKGKNYGWRIMEGLHCYNPGSGCDQNGLELPIWEYDHSSNGGYSITGGYVYEGINSPLLVNKYIYADYVTGNIWAYDLNNNENPNELITKFNAQISTFGIDENKDLYFADYSLGRLYKFEEKNVNSVGTNEINSMKLYQNFPNPFNPSTTISYEVGNINNSNYKVTLDIFNSIGQKITTLINKYQGKGFYEIEFNSKFFAKNGRTLTSGIYFYRLTVNDYVETRKMTIIN